MAELHTTGNAIWICGSDNAIVPAGIVMLSCGQAHRTEHVMRSMILVFFAALCATGAQAVAAAPATEQAQLRVIRTFPADSPAVSQVHRWLLEQPAKMRPPATAAALGQVRTSYVMHASDPARRALLTRTDVAFPERGQTGDAVSIDSCAGDTRLHWTYRWDATSAQAGWQLQASELERVPDCTAAMAALPGAASQG